MKVIDAKAADDHYEKLEPRYQSLLPLKKIYIPSITVGDSVFD
jgi:hypothetical protein